jgi:pyruvate,water dikinase
MKKLYVLPLDDPRATLENVGGKGASLAKMANAGLPVPSGFHVTTEAYWHFVSGNQLNTKILDALVGVDVPHPDTLEKISRKITQMFDEARIPADVAGVILQKYAELPGKNPAVAVRSSATAEDLPDASFAGQQETFLNIIGEEALLEATRKCWASLWTARAIGYRIRQHIPQQDVALAVVIQLLIDAEASGILFTADPVSGKLDQMLINASWGLGEAVVGGFVTPDTLICDKTTGHLIKRETSKKLIQTVRINEGTVNMPVPEHRQNLPVLSDRQAEKLVGLGNQIEDLYGRPMDIEWTLSKGEFAVVQARPITALPAPQAEVPTEWELPEGVYIAMQNNIVELMADPLTPLFKTMGLSAVNASMGGLLRSFFGGADIMPEELIITVNEYAYYNGSIKFGNMIRMFLNAGQIMRKMFTGAVERWTEIGRPKYAATVRVWEDRELEEMETSDLVQAAYDLTKAAVDAYGALVGGVIPAAWISEALFTFVNKMLKRRNDPDASIYLKGFDNVPLRSEKALYDLAKWAQNQPALAEYLLEALAYEIVECIQRGPVPHGVDQGVWENWRSRFFDYLKEYGHMIYNLDFGRPVPADDPGLLIETIQLFMKGQAANPHQRQQELSTRREESVRRMLDRLNGLRRKIFERNLERAQKYAPLREDGLADVGLSYPLVRRILREVGRRFVGGGMIVDPDDIFWLNHEEVTTAAVRHNREDALENRSAQILQRKAIWRAAGQAEPPKALPQIKIFGVDLMALRSGALRTDRAEVLKGVAASSGTVTAAACVIHGPEDFSKMEVGGILVSPLTTPAWTPLFSRAAAIVTDVGGPLSHGSIVAREYGIPAVLGTGGATRRVQNGQLITVDGSSGIVILNPKEQT